MTTQRLWLVSALITFFILSSTAVAGVYKYQDANGRWHFTDKPPKDKLDSSVATGVRPETAKVNLEKALIDKFKPASKVDNATLSVVTVETKTGTGSGFFITSDGFIVTNRHVVRPTTSTQHEDQKSKLAERKQELEVFNSDLNDDEDSLKEMKLNIDDDRTYMESGSATEVHKKQYARYILRYKKNKDKYEKNLARYQKLEKEYKKEKSEFGWNSSMSNFSKRFTITLKNGKKLKTRLVKISKDQDLALLKLDRYTTPSLKLSKQNLQRQGAKVFAIGSPLGMSDSLTTGIITKLDSEHLVTDTQILPGNSGGPLINADGIVLGVNTAVVSMEKNTSGLSLAIYAKHIRKEFAKELAGKI